MCRPFSSARCTRGRPAPLSTRRAPRLAQSNNYQSWATARINLDYEVVHLDKNQAKYDDIHRQYGEAVRIVTTGQVGTSVIYSETAERTAADIVDEFELVRLDEYFDWSRATADRTSGVICDAKGPASPQKPALLQYQRETP